MENSHKRKLIGFVLILFAVSLACNAPFGIGINRPGGDQVPDEVAQLETATPTPTVTPTPTNTGTPTDTPVPTPTSTLVVPYTSTPTAVPGATQAAAPSGGGTPPPPEEATRIAEAATPVPAAPQQPRPAVASTANVIYNGSFEQKWVVGQGLAPGWKEFSNGQGHVSYYDDTWFKVVYDGEHAQLIEIIADQGVGDRYGGIYQTVKVIPNAEYELTIHGLVRSDEGSGEASDFGYGMQYGIDYQGREDWTLVSEWVDLPFPEHPREDPTSENVYTYGTYTTKIVPTGSRLTLYIRAWKKWPHNANEGNWDVDALSLRGTGVQPTLPPPPPAPPTNTPVPGAETSTPTPAPTVVAATATPAMMPESGGEVPSESTPPALVVISIFSIITLLGGAVFGVVRKRNMPQVDLPAQDQGPGSNS